MVGTRFGMLVCNTSEYIRLTTPLEDHSQLSDEMGAQVGRDLHVPLLGVVDGRRLHRVQHGAEVGVARQRLQEHNASGNKGNIVDYCYLAGTKAFVGVISPPK